MLGGLAPLGVVLAFIAVLNEAYASAQGLLYHSGKLLRVGHAGGGNGIKPGKSMGHGRRVSQCRLWFSVLSSSWAQNRRLGMYCPIPMR